MPVAMTEGLVGFVELIEFVEFIEFAEFVGIHRIAALRSQ
jgi:hypothetical protein